MTQPESSNQKEPSKFSKMISGDKAESPLARLPRLKAGSRFTAPASPSAESGSPFSGYKFGPAFWTVTGILSLIVNGVLIGVLLVVMNLLGVFQFKIGDKATGILGGLYNNFAMMQDAHIMKTIPIKRDIPVKFDLNVSGPTTVVLREAVTIDGALVTVNTGGLNINNARATIVLPVNTRLPITIDNLLVPVDKTIPIEFDVNVDIALRDTDLNKPFEGLQNVVKPYLCMVQPNTVRPNPKDVENLNPIYVCK